MEDEGSMIEFGWKIFCEKSTWRTKKEMGEYNYGGY
jgi:hypothetical protein